MNVLNLVLAHTMATLNAPKREEKGATAVEYGLLVGLIAVAIIATLILLGPELNKLFVEVKDGLVDANATTTATTTA